MKRTDLLAHLADRQFDGSSPITVTIGHVGPSGTVQRDSVTIGEAPPVVFGLVATLVANKILEQHNVHLTAEGLRIHNLEG